VNVVVDDAPTVVDWLVGLIETPQLFHAKTGVADAPRATSVANNPSTSADFPSGNLMFVASRNFAYIASEVQPNRHESQIHVFQVHEH
jgi:hypothetical protein